MEDIEENPELDNHAPEEDSFPHQKKSLVITDNRDGFKRWANEEFRSVDFGNESSHWVVTDLPDNVAVLAHPIGPLLSSFRDKNDLRAYPEYHALLSDLPLLPEHIACQRANHFGAGIIEIFLNREDIEDVVVALSPHGNKEFLWRSFLPLLGNTKPVRRFSGAPDPGVSLPVTVYPPEVYDALYQAVLTRNMIDRLITYNLSQGLHLALGEPIFINRVQMSALGCIERKEKKSSVSARPRDLTSPWRYRQRTANSSGSGLWVPDIRLTT